MAHHPPADKNSHDTLRSKRGGMAEITIALDRSSSLSLQDQLRQGIVEAIYAGALRPGHKMPSSRALSDRLDVSRNTVALAYEDLVAEGHLEARSRSGTFVSAHASQGRIAAPRSRQAPQSTIAERLIETPADHGARCPQHWRDWPWPFWDGCIDASLAPLSQWRKAIQLASSPRDAQPWSAGNGELDDAMLLDEIQTKVLPERGISARPEQVLVTASARQALQFLFLLLLEPGMPVYMEEPVDPELLATLRDRGARVAYFDTGANQPLRDNALVVTSARSGLACEAWLEPDTVAQIARSNGVVIELANPQETLEREALRPALYANAEAGNVIHVGRFSPVAACGNPPAFVVAGAPVITELRRRRRVAGALPNLLQQRAWAWFLSLGHYASVLQQSQTVLTARKTALRDALNHYLHTSVEIHTMPGLSSYWVRSRDGRDSRALATRAADAGVLIEPARLAEQRNAFSMGVTALTEERIRDGVRALARSFRASGGPAGAGTGAATDTLSAAALRRALAGKTLQYNTVYGEPCSIEVRRSGELIGMAGYAKDDPDQGRWWIEDDRWFRQWDHWAYGEAEGFAVAVRDDWIYWYNAAGNLVDWAKILRKTKHRKRQAGS